MDDATAQEILRDEFDIPAEKFARLDSFVSMVVRSNEGQNLVARGSLDSIWSRHILDSAQLVRLASRGRHWLDIGTGAGFPGIVVALLHDAHVTMVEPRRLRCNFLSEAVATLGLNTRTQIVCSKLQNLRPTPYDVISARAVAALGELFEMASPFSTRGTIWILPKGRSAHSELDAVQGSWQGRFHVEPSLTDSAAGIIVADQVSRTAKD